MSGIYIHIPFCRSRCTYCAFYSTTALKQKQQYVDAVCKELEMRAETDGPLTAGTIYLGGGTPSQLSIAQLRQLLDAVYIYNKVSAEAEVTLEVNPDDVTRDFAEGLRTLPVNRVSMGAQTFSDHRLQFIHRRHTAAQVAEAVTRLRDAGIANISVDLMYGFPDETLKEWDDDIDHCLALGVEHLSAYCLTIEEGTVMEKWAKENMSPKDDNEELQRDMYFRLIDRLETAGYEHYEISNFARPGCRSHHNSSYWNLTPYRGIGAAAHSYNGHSRSWNISDISRYMEGINRGERICEQEMLDGDTRYNDLVTVALRTREGIDLSMLSETQRKYCLGCARKLIANGLLELTSTHLRLTRQALFISDMVMSTLMMA